MFLLFLTSNHYTFSQIFQFFQLLQEVPLLYDICIFLLEYNYKVLLHLPKEFLHFLNLFESFMLSVNSTIGSCPASAALPINIDIITLVFLFMSLSIFIVCLAE